MKIKLLQKGLLCSMAFLCLQATALAATTTTHSVSATIFAAPPVALAAANVQNTTFGAQWEAVPGATAYRLDVSTTPFGGLGPEDYVYENLLVGNVTYYTVTNLDPGTPYYYRVRAVDAGGISADSNTISTTTAATTTWSGNAWSDGVPTASVNAIIEGLYDNALQGSFTSASLTVSEGASLIVRSGSNLTVVNAITNNAGAQAITIENNANLLQLGNFNNNAGAITVNRNANMRRLDYVYWSAPVTGQNLNAFSPQTLSNRFYILNEATNDFNSIVPTANNFTPAKGFVIRAPNNYTTAIQTFNGQFAGVPNNGTVTIPLAFDGLGFNLIGNPYPSTIETAAFLSENPNISTLYFWTHTQQEAAHNANYATVNATGETAASATTLPSATPNGTIQAGQGFIARVNAAGDAVFSNTMRVVNNDDQFFRTANTEKSRLWLSLADNEGMYNQVLVGYVTGATNAIDNQFDGQLIETEGTHLYSTINGATPYVIQGKGLPFSAADTVALGFMTGQSGNYTIALDRFDGLFAEGQAVYLKDNLTGTVTDIKEGSYSFASVAGNFTDRFSVVYQNTTLGTGLPTASAEAVVVYAKASALYVNSGGAAVTGIAVFDTSGRLLYTDKSLNSSNVTINTLQPAQNLLLVQVTTAEGLVATRKVIY